MTQPTTRTWAGLDADGGLMVQWERGDSGLLLTLFPDGTAAVAHKKDASDHYVSNIEEFRPSDGWPATMREFLAHG